MITVKRLVELDEIEKIQDIEFQVWNMSPTPIHQTYTSSKNGGLVLGAFQNDELIGFQYSFPGFKDGKSYLCSHMLGILPAYQKHGLGEKLKNAQRELALKMGYSLIVWTFDPLESINAYLNVHKLKGICAAYLENHYGMMTDSLNKGLPTDRYLVEWWIDSNHVQKKENLDIEDFIPLVETELNPDGFPVITKENKVEMDPDILFFPIPENFQQLKQQKPKLALEWRYQSRKWFQDLCENGYVAVDVKRSPKERVSFYIFKKRSTLSL